MLAPTRQPCLALLVLAVGCAACRVPESGARLEFWEGETELHVVVNAFLDVVEAHYSNRTDGVLLQPVMSERVTRVDFRYNRMDHQRASGERVELWTLKKGEELLDEERRQGVPNDEYSVLATYQVQGRNPDIEGLAERVAMKVKARLRGGPGSEDDDLRRADWQEEESP